MRRLGASVATEQQNHRDKEIRQGRLRSNRVDVFASGVSTFAPLSIDGQRLAAGTYYDVGGNQVQIFDGVVRQVDAQVFEEEQQAILEREAYLFKMAGMFVASGDDRLARKYMGGFFEALPKGAGFDILRRCLAATNDTNADENAKYLDAVDGRPSRLRYMSDLKPEFTQGIKKLKAVLGFSGIVFSNMSGMNRLPEGTNATIKSAKVLADITGEPQDSAQVNDLITQ